MDDHALDRYVVDQSGAGRPKVCLLPTASGDATSVIAGFYRAFPAHWFEPSVLSLFDRDVADIGGFLGEQDVVYVGGGNTAVMLAAWRVHGVDGASRRAWEAGVVMAGMSAGANCWFEACTTDSFLRGHADPLADGLGLVPGSFTPHYHGEEARRPALHRLIGSGALPDGLACDDFAAISFEDDQVLEAVGSLPGAGAFRVRRIGDRAEEEPLDVRPLGA